MGTNLPTGAAMQLLPSNGSNSPGWHVEADAPAAAQTPIKNPESDFVLILNASAILVILVFIHAKNHKFFDRKLGVVPPKFGHAIFAKCAPAQNSGSDKQPSGTCLLHRCAC
jgi:hypothetical protein